MILTPWQKHFLFSEQQNLFPQWLNWETFASATVFPQQCFLVQPGLKASKSRKKKEQKKKREKRRVAASASRRNGTCIIFWSLGGEPIDANYETETCGIHQLETVDLETLSLFKSRTDLACLGDLLYAKCFNGKAHNVVCDFCAWTIVSIYHMLTFYMFMFMQYLDIMDSQRSGICLIGKCLFIHYRICEI